MKEESQQRINRLLDEIQRDRFSEYMNMCYDSIIGHVEYVDELELPLERKLASIDELIQHFSSLDEFEKCIELDKIKQKLIQSQ